MNENLLKQKTLMQIKMPMSRELSARQQSHFVSFKQQMKFKKIRRLDDHYETLEKLGAGSFGTVKVGKHKRSGMRCAIKTIRKSSLKSDLAKQLNKNEFEILEETQHPHITRVFELMEDDKNFYVVQELMTGGDLYSKLHKDFKGKFSEA